MSKINIDSIQDEIGIYSWKIISTEYKNLDTEMEFECSEGHKVLSTWRKLRSNLYCPICAKNGLKILDTKVISQEKKGFRVLALDQATLVSGYSVIEDGRLLYYGVYKTKGTNEAKRIYDINQWMINIIHEWSPDIVALEDIQMQGNVVTYKTLAHLQGVLINTLVDFKKEYTIISPATWRNYCGVKGRTRSDKKASMRMKVKEWFDVTVTEDEADAIGIGRCACEKNNTKFSINNWE